MPSSSDGLRSHLEEVDLVLLLMLLARSSFFDDWNSPPSVDTVATLCHAIVLGCGLAQLNL